MHHFSPDIEALYFHKTGYYGFARAYSPHSPGPSSTYGPVNSRNLECRDERRLRRRFDLRSEDDVRMADRALESLSANKSERQELRRRNDVRQPLSGWFTRRGGKEYLRVHGKNEEELFKIEPLAMLMKLRGASWIYHAAILEVIDIARRRPRLGDSWSYLCCGKLL